VKRVPVKRPRWATTARVERVMGVDPGLASTGVVILDRSSGSWVSLHAEVVRTEKAARRRGTNIRVTEDDVRRYREVVAVVDNVYRQFVPVAMGLEAYTVKGPSAASWKVGAVYGALLGWAYAVQLYASPAQPLHLKKRFCSPQDASKAALQRALEAEVSGLAEQLLAMPKTQREHAADAAAHAVVMAEELDRVSNMLGLGAP
jgi:Holliday junction resolvasome RuvABC endonuclease subunit